MPEAAIYVDYENLWIELNKLTVVSHGRVSEVLTKIADDNGVPRLHYFRFAYATWWDDRLEGAMEAIARNAFHSMPVVSAGPGKNTADAMMASDIRDMLEHRDCPNLFILATGDHYFGPTADAIHRRGKRVMVVGVAGATNKDLLAASDILPILLDKAVGGIKSGARPGTGTTTTVPSTSFEELRSNLLRILGCTLDAMRARGLQLSANPYIIFSDARRALMESGIFSDQQDAATWLNIAIKEDVFVADLVSHQSGQGSITRCRLNREHQIVRAFLAGVHLSVLRALYTTTIGSSRSFASFTLWLSAVQEEPTLVSNPAFAISGADQLSMWKAYLIKEGAISVEIRTARDGKSFQAFRVALGHPLVQETRGLVAIGGVQTQSVTPREVTTQGSEATLLTNTSVTLRRVCRQPLPLRGKPNRPLVTPHARTQQENLASRLA